MSTGNTLSGDTTAVEAVETELRQIPVGIKSESFGRVIRVTVNLDNIDEIIRARFNRLVVERSIDGGVTYAELGKPSDRAVLNPGQKDYVVRDPDGDPTYFYRFRVANTARCDANGNALLGEASDPIAGIGLAIQRVLTVSQLKNRYLFGVDITNDAGEPFSEEDFSFFILKGIEWLEHQLDIPLLPTRFTNERHDYYREDYNQYSIVKLSNSPVIDVEEWRVQYPSGQNVIVYPKEWIRLEKASGIVQVVPTAGTLSQVVIGQGGSFLPAIYNGIGYMPDLFEFDYIAGFERVPHDLIDIVGMVASFGPLNVFGDLVAGAGIANLSLSVDGLSQSIGTTSSATNSGYGSRLVQYTKEIKDQIPKLRQFYGKSLKLVVA